MGKIGKPLADRVLLKLEEKSESKSSGGIILNTTTQSVQEAEVVEVSDGYIGQSGDTVQLNVKKGDVVLINNGAGQKVKLDGNDYHLVRESEILMVI
jgi:chaperonin GroES|tara:strand:+ start:136 stop:426 length:291 start_codon:yes stop_codon:yes gene_type:complete